MVEIDEMVYVDSSRDWGGRQGIDKFSSGIGSLTYGAAATFIFGRVCTSCDMSRFCRVLRLPILGGTSNHGVSYLPENVTGVTHK